VTQSLEESREPKGEVLSQSVAEGVRIARGETVTLSVSSGVAPCCRVPDLEGLSENEAKEALEDARLALGSVDEQETDEGEKGTVIDQDPAPNETKPEGTEVDIVVAREPEGRGKGKRGNGGGND